jgi:hypothetical protein
MRLEASRRERTPLARETWQSASLLIGAFGVMSLLTSLLLFGASRFSG